MVRKTYNQIYTNTLRGWDKLLSSLYSVETQYQLESFYKLADGFGSLCDQYEKILKSNIYKYPHQIFKRYKEYKSYSNLVSQIVKDFEMTFNLYKEEVNNDSQPQYKNVVVKGFKSYE